MPEPLPVFPLDCVCGGGTRGGGRLIRGRLVGGGRRIGGGRLVGEVDWSEKVSLSEMVALVLLAVNGGTVKEGSGFLPSRPVLGRAIKECAIKACAIEAGAGS